MQGPAWVDGVQPKTTIRHEMQWPPAAVLEMLVRLVPDSGDGRKQSAASVERKDEAEHPPVTRHPARPWANRRANGTAQRDLRRASAVCTERRAQDLLEIGGNRPPGVCSALVDAVAVHPAVVECESIPISVVDEDLAGMRQHPDLLIAAAPIRRRPVPSVDASLSRRLMLRRRRACHDDRTSDES